MRGSLYSECSAQRGSEKPAAFAFRPCAVWKLSGTIVLVRALQNFLVSCYRITLMYGSVSKVCPLRPQWSVVKHFTNGVHCSFVLANSFNLPFVTGCIYISFKAPIFSSLLDGNFLWLSTFFFFLAPHIIDY